MHDDIVPPTTPHPAKTTGLRRLLKYRPAADTTLGLLAVIIATAWTVSTVRPTASSPAPAPPKANLTWVKGPVGTLDDPFVDTAFADCPAGESVIAGGAWTNNADLRIVVNAPSANHKYWIVGISNQVPFETQDARFSAYAICAKPGVPVVPPR